jgi:hypothetical protein
LQKLDVIVIAPKNGLRNASLASQLMSCSNISLSILEAVMIAPNQEVDDLKGIDFKRVEAIHGRMLTGPELGCTISHQNARRIIAESNFGGLILEDDAVVTDVIELIAVCRSFLQRQCQESSLLNLLIDEFSAQTGEPRAQINRRFSPVPLAVAYALTPLAALRLVEANNPISQMNDWPSATVRYFSVDKNLVLHGNADNTSLIDPSYLRRHSPRMGWKVFSLVHYIKHRSIFLGFEDWFRVMYLPRLLRKLDHMMFICSRTVERFHARST